MTEQFENALLLIVGRLCPQTRLITAHDAKDMAEALFFGGFDTPRIKRHAANEKAVDNFGSKLRIMTLFFF
jgi:hypothetical protein